MNLETYRLLHISEFPELCEKLINAQKYILETCGKHKRAEPDFIKKYSELALNIKGTLTGIELTVAVNHKGPHAASFYQDFLKINVLEDDLDLIKRFVKTHMELGVSQIAMDIRLTVIQKPSTMNSIIYSENTHLYGRAWEDQYADSKLLDQIDLIVQKQISKSIS